MSGRGRQVKIEILGDARDAQRAFDGLEKSSGGLGDKLKGVASIASGFILAEGLMRLPGLMQTATDEAIRLESQGRKASIVFGDELGTVQAWAEEAAAGMGLTTESAVGLAAGMGDLLIPMGFTREEAAKMSTDVTDLSGALSEWSGGTRSAAEVSEILTSAMLGERDSLKGLGISISQAEVDARMLENAQKGLTFETEQQAAAVATQQLIMEKSVDAQTAYAESTDDMASKQARLTARSAEFREKLVKLVTPAIMAWQDMLLTVGDTILRYVEPALDGLSDFIEEFVEGPLKDIVEGFEGFRDLIGSSLEGDITDAHDAFMKLPESIWPIGQAIWDLGSFIRTTAIPAIEDFIASMRDGITVSDFTGPLAGIGTAIVDAISTSLDNVDWSGVRSKISGGMAVGFTFATEQAQAIANGISTAFDEVDWTDVQSKIRTGVTNGLTTAGEEAGAVGTQVQQWLTSEIQAVEDWAEVGKALKSGILTGIAVASGGAALAIGIVDWILTSLQENEGDFKAVASDIGSKIATGFGEAVAIGEELVAWIVKSAEEIDWQAAAESIARGIAGALGSVKSIAQGVADSIANSIGNVDWSGLKWESTTGGMTAGLGAALQSALSDAFGEIDPEQMIRDSGFVLTPEVLFGEGGLVETLEDIGEALGDIATVLEEDLGPTLEDAKEAWEEWEPILTPLIGLVGDLDAAILVGLITFALKPLIGILEGAAFWLGLFFDATQVALDGVGLLGEKIQAFVDDVGTIIGWSETAIGAVTNWSETSAEKAGEFLDGMLGPIDELAISGSESISGFVTASAGSFTNWVAGSSTKAGEFLIDVGGKIKDLAEQGVEALDTFVESAVTVLGSLPGRAVGAIGDLSSTLWQAGRDLIQGLIDGVESLIPDFEGVLGGITDSIPYHKGPPEKDRKLLYKNGQLIMEGLIKGFEDMTAALVDALEEMTEAIVEAIKAGYPAMKEAGVGAGEAVVEGTSEGMDKEARKRGSTPESATPKHVGKAQGKDYGEGVAEGVVHTSKDNEESGKRVGGAVARGTSEGMDEEARRGGALPASAKPKPVGVAMGRDFGEGTAEGVVHTSKDNEDAGHRVGGAIARGTEEGMDAGARAGGALPASSHPRPVGVAVGRDFGEGAAEGVVHTSKDNYEAGHAAGAAAANGYNDGVKTVKTSKPGAGNAGGGEIDNSQEPAYGTTITMNGLDLTYIGGGRWAGADGNVYVRGSDGSFQLESGSNTPNSPNTDAPPSGGGGGGGSPVGFLAGSVRLPEGDYTNAELYAASLLQNPLSRLNQPINLTLNVGNSQLISTVLDTALPGMSIEVGG